MTRRLGAQTLLVLELLVLGLTNKEIALRLGLSEPTIKWHVSKLLASYGAVNRAQLVHDAMARGDIGANASPTTSVNSLSRSVAPRKDAR